MVRTAISGFSLGIGLIAAIGAQNVYVLNQGVSRRFVVAVPFVCFLCDVALMSLGVGGIGAAFASSRFLGKAASMAGAAFLGAYGLRAARAAVSGAAGLSSRAAAPGTRRQAVLGALAVTLLNPHVYIDSLLMMGGVGSRFPLPERWAFLAGVLSASFVWFFALSLFGALLAPALARPRVWRVLQAGVCAMLWRQAFDLARFALAG